MNTAMAQTLDKQILQYLPLLSSEEKRSILGVIRSFINLKKDETERISLDDYNRELDEALSRVKGGSYLTQEEVEKSAAAW